MENDVTPSSSASQSYSQSLEAQRTANETRALTLEKLQNGRVDSNSLPLSTSASTLPLHTQLINNPFFTAGFGLAGLGAALAVGRQALKRSAELLRKRLLVDVEITRNDESYQWLLHWMATYHRRQMIVGGVRHGDPIKKGEYGLVSSILGRFMPRMHHLQMQTSRQQSPDGSAQTRFSLVPGPGTHILRFRNTFIWMSRQREKSFEIQTGTPFEIIVLTTLYAQRNVFQELFLEAHQLAEQMYEGKTVMYNSWGTEWRQFGQPKRKRPIKSVVLEKGLKEHILDDVRSFLRARTWYLDRGIPYRRGYLLYGPPGTGKSSFIQALAGELDFNIAILNLSERGITDDRLNHLLSNLPPRTIILLEDADAAFSNRRQADEHGYRGATVTFSGLLNALDGVASAEERIMFLTTNHVDRLDDALVRPGRVDMAVYLGEASQWQVEQLWDRFYEEEKEEEVEQESRQTVQARDEGQRTQENSSQAKARFISEMQKLGLIGRTSTAALQGLFLVNKSDPEGAIAMLKDLATQQSSDRRNRGNG